MKITFKVDDAEALARKLGGLTPQEIARQNVALLNDVTQRTYDLARNRITVGINLSDDYLRRRMRVESASESKPVASIVASGARSDMSRLVVYPNQTRTAPKVSTRNRRRAFSPLGLGAGNKPAGLDVEVTRGNEKFFENGFLMPLKAPGQDSGYQGFGIFARTRGGKLKQRYGPSVYQLFAYQINDEEYIGRVEQDLETTILDGARSRVQEALR